MLGQGCRPTAEEHNSLQREVEDAWPKPEPEVSTSAFSKLPADVWQDILRYLASQSKLGTVANVALTCRALDELAMPILYHTFPVTERSLLTLALHFPIGTSEARAKLLESVWEYERLEVPPKPKKAVRIPFPVRGRRKSRLRMVKCILLAKRTGWLGPALETFFRSTTELVFPRAHSASVLPLGTWPNFCFCCYSPWRIAYAAILKHLARPTQVCYNFPSVEDPPEDSSRWVARPREVHIQPLMPIDLVFDVGWLGDKVSQVTYHDHSAEDGLVPKQNIHHCVHVPIAPGPNPNRRRFCRRAFIQAAIRDKTVRYGLGTTFEFVLDSLDDDDWAGIQATPGSEWDDAGARDYVTVPHSLNHHSHGEGGRDHTISGIIEYMYRPETKERPAIDLDEEKAATFEVDRCPTPDNWERIKEDAGCVTWSLVSERGPCSTCGLPLVSEAITNRSPTPNHHNDPLSPYST